MPNGKHEEALCYSTHDIVPAEGEAGPKKRCGLWRRRSLYFTQDINRHGVYTKKRLAGNLARLGLLHVKNLIHQDIEHTFTKIPEPAKAGSSQRPRSLVSRSR